MSRLATPSRVVVVGFALAILAGTALLAVPGARTGPAAPDLGTALFTATSAVTLTGLTVVDTATYWSGYGQVVILALVQVGGFGVMTLASLLFLLVARRVGLRSRLAAQVERGVPTLGELRRVLVGVAVLTVAFEAAVAVAFGLRLFLGHGRSAAEAARQGVFHSVSAFNNAGFSLYSDNLTDFLTDPWIVGSVCVAVIAGGLGFPVWLELAHERRARRWRLHTKLTLATTGALLVIGVGALTALEWDNPRTLGGLGAGGRLTGGLLAGVMPRTAGFNGFDYAEAAPETLLVTDMLMLVGGASAGTAGGIKVTTLALLLLAAWSELRGRGDLTAFRRRVPAAPQRQALVIAVLAVVAVAAGTLTLMVGGGHGLSPALFEATSAFGTVGLSTGITPRLDAVGQGMLMALMFAGRVGTITLGVALVLRERERRYRHPEERPLVG